MKTKDTKEFILMTSLKLFLQKGFKEVTMAEILSAAGLSKGAFYHHFRSKEQVFEEAVRYFYNRIMITDFSAFPTDSLKAFYKFYIENLNRVSDELVDTDDSANIFIFISDATRRIPTFFEIHYAQREKEIAAWSAIAATAKERNEIRSGFKNRDIALMFLNLSDGIALNGRIGRKSDMELLHDITRDWDNLYRLLKKNSRP